MIESGEPLRATHSKLLPIQRFAAAVLVLDGQKTSVVAKKVGCSPKAVRVWSERIIDDDDPEDDHRSGRPKMLKNSVMDAIIDAAIENPKTSTPRELKHLFDFQCNI